MLLNGTERISPKDQKLNDQILTQCPIIFIFFLLPDAPGCEKRCPIHLYPFHMWVPSPRVKTLLSPSNKNFKKNRNSKLRSLKISKQFSSEVSNWAKTQFTWLLSIKARYLTIAWKAHKSTSKCESVQSALIAQKSTTICYYIRNQPVSVNSVKSTEERHLVRMCAKCINSTEEHYYMLLYQKPICICQ